MKKSIESVHLSHHTMAEEHQLVEASRASERCLPTGVQLLEWRKHRRWVSSSFIPRKTCHDLVFNSLDAKRGVIVKICPKRVACDLASTLTASFLLRKNARIEAVIDGINRENRVFEDGNFPSIEKSINHPRATLPVAPIFNWTFQNYCRRISYSFRRQMLISHAFDFEKEHGVSL